MRRRKQDPEPTAKPASDAVAVYGPSDPITGRFSEGPAAAPPSSPEGWRPQEFEDVETPDDEPVADLVDLIGKV